MLRIYKSFLFLIVFTIFLPVSANEQDDSATVLLATTTSTDNSGLIDYILPTVEEDTGYTFKVIAVGTGKALKMGEAGDVDVLLVHAKNSELSFVESGFGVDRTKIMYNDFVLVGPKSNSLDKLKHDSLQETMQSIASEGALFLSRGDDSGTHKKELALWAAADIEPVFESYREAGQGMGKTLQIADELNAFTLTDRGTWIFSMEKLGLEIVYEGDEYLNNQYSAIAVSPDLHDINYAGATRFINWLASEKGQSMINAYRLNGQQLFFGNSEKAAP